MQALRKRVRVIALAWLLCQAGSLSAFVPENCCLAHVEEAAAKAKKEACHEAEPVKPEAGRCVSDGACRRRGVPDAQLEVEGLLRHDECVRWSGLAPRHPVRLHRRDRTSGNGDGGTRFDARGYPFSIVPSFPRAHTRRTSA